MKKAKFCFLGTHRQLLRGITGSSGSLITELGHGDKVVSRAQLHARLVGLMAKAFGRKKIVWTTGQTRQLVCMHSTRGLKSTQGPLSKRRRKQLELAYNQDKIPVSLVATRWLLIAGTR
jgi:hypothetical protein